MKRELFGQSIEQRSKTGFFNASDLVKAGNKWRRSRDMLDFNLTEYLRNQSTKDFIDELHRKYDVVLERTRGRNAKTWVHPLLFIDIALAISPKLKVETYEWLFDNLIKFRNDSGDSYKEMCAGLYVRFGNKREFPKFISDVALKIKSACGVNDWQSATEDQLAMRDKIHYIVKAYTNVITNPDEAVRLALAEVKPSSLKS